jgi:hypothetical protein
MKGVEAYLEMDDLPSEYFSLTAASWENVYEVEICIVVFFT